MGVMNKVRNGLKVGKGRAKASYGRAAGRPDVEARGHAERTSGGVRQVMERSKDGGKKLRRKLKK